MANRLIVGYGPNPLSPAELIEALHNPGDTRLFPPQWRKGQP
ncbi:MAG: hypothetical protein AB7P76_02480 [Candidatus Melainabacteria bacterium]